MPWSPGAQAVGTLGEGPGQCCTPGVLGGRADCLGGTRNLGGWWMRGLSRPHEGAGSLVFLLGLVLPPLGHSGHRQHPSIRRPAPPGTWVLQGRGGPSREVPGFPHLGSSGGSCSPQGKAQLLRAPCSLPSAPPHPPCTSSTRTGTPPKPLSLYCSPG